MNIDDDALERFFVRYGTALASGDLPGISACYAYPSYVPGDYASVVITAANEIEAFFAGAAEGYHAQGMTRAVPELTAIEHLSPALVEAEVRWSYTDDAGTEQQHDRFRYTVRHHGDQISICVVAAIRES